MGPFPTNEVENSSQRRRKFGKSSEVRRSRKFWLAGTNEGREVRLGVLGEKLGEE